MKNTAETAVKSAMFGLALWFASGSDAQAQSDCRSFQAVAQAALPSSTPLAAQTGVADVWGGPFSGILAEEFVQGVLSGNDGAKSQDPDIGIARGGQYTVGVGCTTKDGVLSCTDTFTYEVPVAVYTRPPGFGHYTGDSAKIVRGTGRFQAATGNLNISGAFIAWPDPASPRGASGRWNAKIIGQLCGVQ